MAGSISVAIASDQSIVPVSGPLTDAQLRATAVPVSGTLGVSGNIEVVNDVGNPLPVSATSLPLPTGASTAANQSTANASLASIDGKLVTEKTGDFDTSAGTDTVAMQGIALPKSGGAVAGGTSTDPLRVDPTGTTTQPISAVSLPLPTGAATSANQTTANTALSAIQTSVEAIDNAIAGTEMQVDVVGPLPAGTNSIGQVTANAGMNLNTSALNLESTQAAIRTAAELLDDSIHADDGVRGKSLLIGAALDDTTPAAITENQAGFLRMTSGRALHTSVRDALPAGTNNIGDVDVLSLPALPTGTNNIGDVDVLTLPAIPTGDNTIGRVKITDGTDVADVLDLTNSNPLTVAIVDGAGTQVTSFGGGTQYDEDTASSPADKLTMAGVVRKDSAASLVDLDGDRTQLQVDASGALRVTGGGGGTEYTEDIAAPADPVGATFMMTRDDQLSTVTEIEGDWSRPRGTSKGALWVSIPDVNGDPITSFGGGTQYTEDAVAAADPIGTALNLIRRDSPAALTSTDGDNVAARGTNRGELYVKQANETANGSLSATGQSVTATLNGAGTLAVQVTGTWDTATLNFEATVDDSNWFAANAYVVPPTPLPVTSTQGTGQWLVPVAGFKKFRVRASEITNGPAVVSIEASVGTSLAFSVLPVNSTMDIARLSGTAIATNSGIVNGGTQRVVIATDQAQLTNALKVDGSAITQPISGTVTANAGTNLNTSAIAGTVTANAGTNLNTSALALETTQSAIKTATELIDDCVHADNATHGKSLLIGAVLDDTTPVAMTENNAGYLRMTPTRGLHVSVQDALPTGDNNIGNVDVLTMPNITLGAGTNTNEIVGDVAEDIPLAGNPVRMGIRASTAIPAAMSADGDVVTPWANRSGAQVMTQAPHVGLNSDPWNLQSKTAQYTTTQTSTVLQAGGASEKIIVTDLQIQVGGTTGGTVEVYFGTGAYVRGTNRAIFDGEFAPSATLKPGVVMKGPFISGANGDDVLVTTSAAINPITITIWYYVVS